MNQAWIARFRSLLDEHERNDAEQVAALRAVLNPGEAVVPRSRIPVSLKSLVEAYERTLILEALADAGGIQKRAAASLDVRCTTLNEKIKRLGIQLPAPMGTQESLRDDGDLIPVEDG